jgi:hypothetical protein
MRVFNQTLRLFDLFWSVEKHDANPANSGMMRLPNGVNDFSDR